MRLGGAFTFSELGVPVDLASGQVWYPPPGNYFFTLGAQTLWQYFDNVNLQWRSFGGQVAGPPNVMSVDGYNYRLLNASGIVAGASITAAGSGATNGIGAAATGVAITWGSAPANGQLPAAYPIVGGQIPSTINIANGGSGFVVAPLVLIDPPPLGGIQATARCTISAGAINAVTVDNQGAGYTSLPNIYVIPQYATYPGIGIPVNPAGAPSIVPGGLLNFQQPPFLPGINWSQVLTSASGALLNFGTGVLAGSGTLTGIVMTAYGAGYTGTTIPTITVTGAGAATATALMSMCLTSITITSGGVAYSADTHIIESNYGLLTAATNINNNGFYGPRRALGRATQSGGIINATVIEDAGFGFQTVPRLGVIATSGTPPTTVANLTAVVGGINDTSIVQPAVSD